MSKEQDAGRCRPAPTSRGLSGIVSFQYVEKHYDSRQAGMTIFYDFIKHDDFARSTFSTRRHKGTKKGILKIFKFFFVISVIFV
jgi:hypothetical protein